jgi:hypothetical protein
MYVYTLIHMYTYTHILIDTSKCTHVYTVNTQDKTHTCIYIRKIEHTHTYHTQDKTHTYMYIHKINTRTNTHTSTPKNSSRIRPEHHRQRVAYRAQRHSHHHVILPNGVPLAAATAQPRTRMLHSPPDLARVATVPCQRVPARQSRLMRHLCL